MADQLYMQGMSYNETDHWADRANCAGKAYELFEYQEKDSPLARDMDFQERRAFNATNFELAAEICIECPVFIQCGESATVEDKQWTVRAGETPTRFAYEDKRNAGPKVPRVCSKSHYVPNGGRCPACKNAAQQRSRKSRAKLT